MLEVLHQRLNVKQPKSNTRLVTNLIALSDCDYAALYTPSLDFTKDLSASLQICLHK